MKAEIPERVRRIAADLFGVPFEQIQPRSSPETIDSWDSLQHLNLVLALEGEFGVQFAPEEMAKMVNLDTISSLIQEKMPAKISAATSNGCGDGQP